MKNALIVFWSKTGNTEKVANAIKQGLEEADIKVAFKKPEEAAELDYFDYDLVSVGCPSYSWHPPEPVTNFLKKKFAEYRQNGKIKLSAPKVPRKKRAHFCNLFWSTHGNRRGHTRWKRYTPILRTPRLQHNR